MVKPDGLVVKIEKVLQGDDMGEPTTTETPEGFGALLAQTLPLARSGFQEHLEGRLLAKFEESDEDRYLRIELPVGGWYIAFNSRGITYLAPAEGNASFQKLFQERFGRKASPAGELPPKVKRAAKALMEGKAKIATPVDLANASSFTQEVLAKAREIPRGEVRSYAWIAKELGQPRAARAVGAALGANPVPLLIPCHRVIGSDGSLGGYAWGRARKERILAWEGMDLTLQEERARKGIRYYGSDTTHIYCEPTCRHARRVKPEHRVYFHSQKEAESAGYRPCRVCRPK